MGCSGSWNSDKRAFYCNEQNPKIHTKDRQFDNTGYKTDQRYLQTSTNFHIMLNSIGYVAGMTHGLLLSENLDSISLSLAITMTVLMTSGVLLRYTSSRNTKVFNRLLHGQFGLMILLVALIVLHVLSADD